jgi:hypothetical protein
MMRGNIEQKEGRIECKAVPYGLIFVDGSWVQRHIELLLSNFSTYQKLVARNGGLRHVLAPSYV